MGLFMNSGAWSGSCDFNETDCLSGSQAILDKKPTEPNKSVCLSGHPSGK
jgi:hypothetical protein